MFSPTLGRWIQNDPIEFEAGHPNLYRFVANNPANLLDSTGLCAETYPRPLTPEELRLQRNNFLNFPPDGRGIKVLGPPDQNSNCIGHACGIQGRIDGQTPPKGSKIKPPRVAAGMPESYIDEVMSFYGFKKVSGDCKPQMGKIRVATYGVPRRNRDGNYHMIRYAAVSTNGAPWQSKMGSGLLIEHDSLGVLEDVPKKSENYGNVVGCYEKDVPKQDSKKCGCDH